MLKRSMIWGAVLIGLSGTCIASIPDGNIVPGRWEISGGSGLRQTLTKDYSNDFVGYQWNSIQINYDKDNALAFGASFYGETYLRKIYFKDDPDFFEKIVTNIFFSIIPNFTFVDNLADIYVKGQFMEEKKGGFCDVSWLFGIAEASGWTYYGTYRGNVLFPELGLCLSKKVGDFITLRLNPVLGVSGGAEIGLKLLNNLELTYCNEGLLNCKIIF